MEKVKIYARVLHINVVGHTACIAVNLCGVEFEDKIIPKDFPSQTLGIPCEFLVHFGDGNISEEDIAQLIPDKLIAIESVLSENEVVINKIITRKVLNSTDVTLPERLQYLKQMGY